ncbi:MAG TPA: ABC transporter substrate-binding protein [Alphaproteobacteria bacterium]|nr:ABC transporter substrate-binding protein [Alphaproteobacteria bacterium]
MAALIAVGLAVSPNSTAQAGELADPTHLVQEFGNRILGQLIVDRLPSDAERVRLHDLFEEDCDLSQIGRFALGRIWYLASPAERERFQHLFEANLIDAYVRHFQRYSGARLTVTDQHPDSESDTIVLSQIETTDKRSEPLSLAWRVRREPSGPKIVDMVIQGVSVAASYRDEVSSLLHNEGSVEGLLRMFQKRTRMIAASAEPND